MIYIQASMLNRWGTSITSTGTVRNARARRRRASHIATDVPGGVDNTIIDRKSSTPARGSGDFTFLNFDGPCSVGTIYTFFDTHNWYRGMGRANGEVSGCYPGSNIQNTYKQASGLTPTTRDDVILSINNPSTCGDVIILTLEKRKDATEAYMQIFCEKEIQSFDQIDIFQVYELGLTIGLDGTGLGLGEGGADANYDYITTNTDSPLNIESGLTVTSTNLAYEFVTPQPGGISIPPYTSETIVENPYYYSGTKYGTLCRDDASWLDGYYGYVLKMTHAEFGTQWWGWNGQWMYRQNLYLKVTFTDGTSGTN